MRLSLASLVLALLALPGSAQPAPKVVHDPKLDGGHVTVEGLFDVIYVGDVRHAARPETLRTAWVTVADGKARRVVVQEERLPGQDARSWQLEHARLVSSVARQFPPALRRLGT